jgi:hypothetical protein
MLAFLLIITSIASFEEVHTHHHILRHRHYHYNDYYSTSNATFNLKHGHHFYGRHKRKMIEEQHHSEHLHWPIKRISEMEGDVILGGLMMVHEREDNATCGPIMPQGGIQALEAMLFTLDRINENQLVGPNVKIGAHILDDCD